MLPDQVVQVVMDSLQLLLVVDFKEDQHQIQDLEVLIVTFIRTLYA
jgi:hypothetical protein